MVPEQSDTSVRQAIDHQNFSLTWTPWHTSSDLFKEDQQPWGMGHKRRGTKGGRGKGREETWKRTQIEIQSWKEALQARRAWTTHSRGRTLLRTVPHGWPLCAAEWLSLGDREESCFPIFLFNCLYILFPIPESLIKYLCYLKLIYIK